MDVAWYNLKEGEIYTITHNTIKKGTFSGFKWIEKHSQWMLHFKDVPGYPECFISAALPYTTFKCSKV